jgi:type IV secretory pathway VirJ component
MMRLFLFFLAGCLALFSTAQAEGLKEFTDKYGPFGTLHMYQPEGTPERLVIFITGDGGWDDGMVNMARPFAEQGAMVAGVDVVTYMKNLNASHDKCSYGAAHFEGLSQYLQKKYQFPRYTPPVLVGYSSGATIVYATLAQSPANTFAGGISLGFCPDLKTKKPFCKGSGTLASTPDAKLGFIYQPTTLPAPWVALQGEDDKVCSPPATQAFVGKVTGGQVVMLPKVGHGFAVQKNWMGDYQKAYQSMISQQKSEAPPAPKAEAISDLPLVELPAAQKSDTLAVIVTGDGGWASINKQIGETLKADGIGVVGLNSLQYFWEKKTPEALGADLTRILEHYTQAGGAEHVLLVGYSRGADTLPFMASRLPDALKAKVKTVALLGMEDTTDFEFHVDDWLTNNGDGQHKVLPEVAKLKGMNILCLYSSEEDNSACRKLDASLATSVEMKGGHHFGGDYEKIAQLILQHHGK